MEDKIDSEKILTKRLTDQRTEKPRNFEEIFKNERKLPRSGILTNMSDRRCDSDLSFSTGRKGKLDIRSSNNSTSISLKRSSQFVRSNAVRDLRKWTINQINIDQLRGELHIQTFHTSFTGKDTLN